VAQPGTDPTVLLGGGQRCWLRGLGTKLDEAPAAGSNLRKAAVPFNRDGHNLLPSCTGMKRRAGELGRRK